MIIAIDGVSGSGKSTTAKRLAKKLDFFHIDSGALYRVATYFCIINKIKSDDKDIELKLDKTLLMSVEIIFDLQSTILYQSLNPRLHLKNLQIHQLKS